MSLSIFSSKRLPVAVLLCILCFGVFRILLVRVDAFWDYVMLFSTPAEDDGIRLEYRLRECSRDTAGRKAFIIGSSLAAEDVDAEYLSKRFSDEDMKFYNMAVSGGQAADIFQLSGRFIEKSPDLIIYVISRAAFYQKEYDFRKMKYYFEPEFTSRVVKYFGWGHIFEKRSYFLDSYISELSFLYKYRESLARIHFESMEDLLRPEKKTEPTIFKYNKAKSDSELVQQSRTIKDIYRPSRYTALNEELFAEAARRIIGEGIRFIVIDGPTNPLIGNCYDSKIDTMYHDFIAARADSIGFTFISSGERPDFSREEFQDLTHMNPIGRARFTEFIGDLLED